MSEPTLSTPQSPSGIRRKDRFFSVQIQKNATIYPALLPAPQGDVSILLPEKTGKSPGLYAKSAGRNRPFPRRFWPTLPHGFHKGSRIGVRFSAPDVKRLPRKRAMPPD